ncbi:MAG: hypothetical protein HOD64_01160, partial [Candidatus Cloacimonetes bacterium]|nr:hypothetical protein [Candidatus Cloacimonadota bacterium]
SNSPINDIITPLVDWQFYTSGSDSLTLSAITSKFLWIHGPDDGNVKTVILSGALNAESLKLGWVSNTGSGVLTLADGTTNTIGSITDGSPLNSDNAITFGGTTTITNAFDTSNIKTINSSGIIIVPSVTIDSTGTNNTTWTLDEDTTISGDFTIQETLGTTTIDTNGNTLSVGGSVLFDSADDPTITEMNLTMTGSGETLTWNDYTNRISTLTLATGSSITLTGTVRYDAISGDGDLNLGGKAFVSGNPVSDFWTYTGDITGAGTVSLTIRNSISNTEDINTGAATTSIISTADTLTLNNLFTTGELFIGTSTIVTGLTVNGNLTCDALTIGTSGNTGSGILTLASGTTNTIGSIVAGDPLNSGNELNFGASRVLTSGIFDGDNIAITSNEAFIFDGTVVNVDNAGSPAIKAINSVDGLNNTNVIFPAETFDTPVLMLTKYGQIIQKPISALDRLRLVKLPKYGSHPNPLNYQIRK